MTSIQRRPTAKIYAFPSGGRAPPNRTRERLTTAYLPQHADTAERGPKTVYGGSWYHQEAVDEAWDR
jgi:hypothetical protein